jgi:hypothetical protein
MSRYFRAGGLSLWNPSNGVAVLFVRTGEAIATTTEVPSGLGPLIADEHEIDPEAFAVFVDALTEEYRSSDHPILRSLLEGFLAIAIVLVDRSGRDLPSLRITAMLDPRDVSVGVDGVRPLGSLERLLRLADEHATAMPR